MREEFDLDNVSTRVFTHIEMECTCRFDISESSDKKQSEKNLREMLLHQEYRECVTHRPTLLIGLGGTGVKSLYRFRHMMIRAWKSFTDVKSD